MNVQLLHSLLFYIAENPPSYMMEISMIAMLQVLDISRLITYVLVNRAESYRSRAS